MYACNALEVWFFPTILVNVQITNYTVLYQTNALHAESKIAKNVLPQTSAQNVYQTWNSIIIHVSAMIILNTVLSYSCISCATENCISCISDDKC